MFLFSRETCFFVDRIHSVAEYSTSNFLGRGLIDACPTFHSFRANRRYRVVFLGSKTILRANLELNGTLANIRRVISSRKQREQFAEGQVSWQSISPNLTLAHDRVRL